MKEIDCFYICRIEESSSALGNHLQILLYHSFYVISNYNHFGIAFINIKGLLF